MRSETFLDDQAPVNETGEPNDERELLVGNRPHASGRAPFASTAPTHLANWSDRSTISTELSSYGALWHWTVAYTDRGFDGEPSAQMASEFENPRRGCPA